MVASDRWKALKKAGAREQRPLWASTGVKDPKYSDDRYVVELAAPGCVNTMPEATLEAVGITETSTATRCPERAPTLSACSTIWPPSD